jgi:hypothetical protein
MPIIIEEVNTSRDAHHAIMSGADVAIYPQGGSCKVYVSSRSDELMLVALRQDRWTKDFSRGAWTSFDASGKSVSEVRQAFAQFNQPVLVDVTQISTLPRRP